MFAANKNHFMQVIKNAGYVLLAGCFLITITMVLHPAGGSVEKILKIKTLIIVTHAIAVLSMPFCMIGFWGLTKLLGSERLLPISAFAISVFGLIAVMCAGVVNGFALPLFVQRYAGADAETIESIKPVLRYGASLNHGFDYVFIGAMCLSILLWSIAILQTKPVTKWLAYLGIVICAAAIVMLFGGFEFVSLSGFRVFVFGIVAWIVWAGLSLVRVSKT
jgi:hypothetical protein